MNIVSIAKYGLSVGMAATLLAGCSAGGSQSGLLGAPEQSGALARHGVSQRLADLRKAIRSGIIPSFHRMPIESQTRPNVVFPGRLVYVSDLTTGSVEVFRYHTGVPYFGAATGFTYPFGECSDLKGNVFVTDFGADTISEIRTHTATVIATANMPTGSEPIGCAVDQRTGNLAVTLFDGGSLSTPVSVLVCPFGISGCSTPATYYYTAYTWPAGYDKNGNLYVQGQSGTCANYCVWTIPAPVGPPALVTWNETICYPAAIERNHNTLVFGEQESNCPSYSTFESLYPTVCVATTCTSGAPVVLAESRTACATSSTDLVQWAENAVQSDLQSRGVVAGNYAWAGGNLWCSSGGFPEWKLAGGFTFFSFGPNLPDYPTGQTIIQ